MFHVEEPSSSAFDFSSIAGYGSVKEELLQVVDMMQNREAYEKYDLRIPRGVLLEGPPGNGKTLLAKCFAGEVNASFIACSGSNFQDKYVGVASGRIRELFHFAQENTPSVIFIDELDALGRARSGIAEEAGAEKDSTLNQLLVQLDGFRARDNILVLSATNRVDVLDKALTRPGRFDKIIHVPNPDEETRTGIAQIHIMKKPISVTPAAIGEMTRGFSGAMIENLLNEASLYGIRKNLTLPVGMPVVQQIADKMTMGTSAGSETSKVSEDMLRRVAVHEVGHVLAALLCEAHDNPVRVSIETPSHRMVGVAVFNGPGEGDIDLILPEYLNAHLLVLLAGKAAEEIVFGSSSAGCISDLQSAMELTKKMLIELGMGKQIIYPLFSEAGRERIGNEILEVIETKYTECVQMLQENRQLMDILTERLIQEKTLSIEQLLEIIG
jgi:cell division protease FtsH